MLERREANQVFLSLGSNIHPEINLPAAVRQLQQFGEITGVSTVYETLPVGFADQANFLNAAVLLETELPLAEILDTAVPSVERMLGRVRDPARQDGPRTIDVDVLLFNDVVTQIGRHSLPDPDIAKYAFIAVPLAELDPTRNHPVIEQTLAEIAARLPVSPGDMQPRRDVRLL